MSSQGFPRQLRLLTAGDYRRVFDSAAFKVHGKGLMALASPNDLGHPRLGLIFSKKNVRRAVDRNRLKRIARDSIRLRQHRLPPVDIVLLARRRRSGSGQRHRPPPAARHVEASGTRSEQGDRRRRICGQSVDDAPCPSLLAPPGACIRVITPDAIPLDLVAFPRDALRANASLPPAGFRVCRAGERHRATGLFTTHRADPSWM